MSFYPYTALKFEELSLDISAVSCGKVIRARRSCYWCLLNKENDNKSITYTFNINILTHVYRPLVIIFKAAFSNSLTCSFASLRHNL